MPKTLSNDTVSTLIDLGEYRKAIASAYEGLQKNPMDQELHYYCAYGNIELRKFKVAKKHISAMSSINPNDLNIHLVNAHLLMRQNKFKEAERLLLDMAETTQAIECYLKLIKLYQTRHLLVKYKISKFRKKNREKIIFAADKINIVHDRPYLAELLKAETFAITKQYKFAHQFAENCIGLNPNEAYPYFLKSFLCVQTESAGAARHWVEQGLRIAPDDSWGLDLLALIHTGLVKSHRNLRTLARYGSFVALALVLGGGVGSVAVIKVGAFGFAIYEKRRYKRHRLALSKIELKSSF